MEIPHFKLSYFGHYRVWSLLAAPLHYRIWSLCNLFLPQFSVGSFQTLYISGLVLGYFFLSPPLSPDRYFLRQILKTGAKIRPVFRNIRKPC